jgi:hypothetical protein
MMPRIPRWVSDVKMYGRFARGLRGFLRRTVSLDEARETVKRGLAEREANFLRMAERGIFGHRRSPYRRLLALAGCELGDLRNMVRTRGLEATLQSLRDAGVYVTFEEFKGREPLVRHGQRITAEPRDFDNPFPSRAYQVESGGTTGAGTRVDVDLEHLAEVAPLFVLVYHAHGVLHVPTALWYGVLPDGTGVGNLLRHARVGQITERWFSPVTARDLRPGLKYRLATRGIVELGRLHGAPLPRPEPVGLESAEVVARWAADALRTHRTCMIRTTVSRALRVSIAAQAAGLDLTGAVFFGGAEPPTPGKVGEIERSGARHVSHYASTETGYIGAACTRPIDGNDLHFFKDGLALIQHARTVPGTDVTVPAFCFTSLRPAASKILLNVESDDYGVVEHRACGCPLEAAGFTEHLREIRSFRKLTGEGVTLIGSDMVRILEEVLPARFGGGPLDYQLLEEEDEQHITRLTLLVSPRVTLADEQAVVDAVLDTLGRGSVSADMARAIWIQAKTLRIRRAEPIWTARGKFMPLRVVRRTGGDDFFGADGHVG